MTATVEPTVQWSQDQMVEVTLNEPDDFLKVRETLTRIGVASRKEKKLYQSCHILHKQGRYYIVHFKELFALDGKHANLTVNDVQRRNRIARLILSSESRFKFPCRFFIKIPSMDLLLCQKSAECSRFFAQFRIPKKPLCSVA